MITFFRAQIASFTASIIDFSVTILCVQSIGVWYLLGSVLGTIAGGAVNFSMGRNWVFQSKATAIKTQMLKYTLVWLGYLILINYGVFLLTEYFTLNYMLSKVVMTGLFGIPYNYLLQKKFIFSPSVSKNWSEKSEGF